MFHVARAFLESTFSSFILFVLKGELSWLDLGKGVWGGKIPKPAAKRASQQVLPLRGYHTDSPGGQRHHDGSLRELAVRSLGNGGGISSGPGELSFEFYRPRSKDLDVSKSICTSKSG